MNILERILAEKREQVARDRAAVPESALRDMIAAADPPRGFARAIAAAAPLAIIAEIKRKSPSAGELRPDLDPATLARFYRDGGAMCLSVLTDAPHFGSSLEAMRAARAASGLPTLRKEFIVDRYQITEARAHNADAILLIAGALDANELADFHAEAITLGMDVLLEVHNEDELEIAERSAVRPAVLGINNRDLKAQRTDLATFARLAPRAGALSAILVAESGIRDRADAVAMQAAGARALLVGESLLRMADPGAGVRALLDR